MKLLALDTATEACSVALRVDGATLARYEVLGRGHAERLLPMVDEVLAEAGLALGALDAIAFGRGPGAFTGVRIAVGLAQGLAFGAGLPVVPVSDLAALGRLALDRRLATVDADATAAAVPGAAAASGSARALVCLDARMGEVYWAEVVARADGGVDVPQERLGPPETVVLVGGPSGPGGAGGRGGAGPGVPLVGAGHGWSAYPALAARFPDVTPVWQDLLPRAHEVATLAALEVAAGRVVAPEDAAPVYLRDDVATRSGRQSPFAGR